MCPEVATTSCNKCDPRPLLRHCHPILTFPSYDSLHPMAPTGTLLVWRRDKQRGSGRIPTRPHSTLFPTNADSQPPQSNPGLGRHGLLLPVRPARPALQRPHCPFSSSYARPPHESKGIPWPSCYPPYPQLPPRGSSLNTPQDPRPDAGRSNLVLDAASPQFHHGERGLGMARCTFCFPAPWRPVVDCYSLMSLMLHRISAHVGFCP